MIPTWYTDFWCPDDMRKFDPQGCGIGLGIGAMVLIVVALSILVIVGLLAFAVIDHFIPEKEGTHHEDTAP
jgi:hypothetical protein